MAKLVYVEPVNALPSTIVYDYGKAADGPDYGVASSKIPYLIDEGYQPVHVIIIPANYGKIGPVDIRSNKWQKNINLGVAGNPLGMPQYNSATPQGLFHLKVDNAQQFARWQVNSMPTDPGIPAPIPASYTTAGAATLFGGK